MSRDQAFREAALSPRRQAGRSVGHEFQHVQQLPCDVDLALVAGVVKGQEDLVGQTPRVSRLWGKGDDIGHPFRSRTPAPPPLIYMGLPL
jgi:hypothetical protein